MRAWTVSGAEGGGCGELGVTGNDEGAHSAASFFSVSGLCQQRGIQVSTERLSAGSLTQPCFVSVTSVSLSGSQSASLSASLNFQLCSSGTPA